MTKNKIIQISILLLIFILIFLFIILPLFFGRYWWINYSNYKQESFSFSESTIKIPNKWNIVENQDNSIKFLDENGNVVVSGLTLEKDSEEVKPEYIIRKILGYDVKIKKDGKSKYLNGDVYWSEYILENSAMEITYLFKLYLTDCNQSVVFVTTQDINYKTVDKIVKSLRT